MFYASNMSYVFSIFDFDTKTEVFEGIDLKNNGYYVAVGADRFKDLDYGSANPVVLSPQQQQKRWEIPSASWFKRQNYCVL